MPITDDVQLGPGVKIFHPQLVNLYGCSIGADTKVGAFVEVQKNAFIGERCKISSHTFICEGVTIEDEVFVGHGVMFINDRFPRATAGGALQTEADWEVIPTVINRQRCRYHVRHHHRRARPHRRRRRRHPQRPPRRRRRRSPGTRAVVGVRSRFSQRASAAKPVFRKSRSDPGVFSTSYSQKAPSTSTPAPKSGGSRPGQVGIASVLSVLRAKFAQRGQISIF